MNREKRCRARDLVERSGSNVRSRVDGLGRMARSRMRLQEGTDGINRRHSRWLARCRARPCFSEYARTDRAIQQCA